MKMNSKYQSHLYLIVLLVFLYVQNLTAQSLRDSTNYLFPKKKNRLLLQAQKHINTLNINSDFFYKTHYKNFNFGIDSKINTAYFLAGNQSYRTARKIKIYTDYFFAKYFKSGFYISHNFFNDDKRLSISSAEVNQMMLYSTLGLENFQLNLFGGISKNSQVNNTDTGPIYGAEGFIDSYKFENQIVTAKFHLSNEDISPRKNLLRNFEVSLLSLVSPDFTNTLGFGYFERGKDFYIPIDSLNGEFFNTTHNIENRLEQNYFVSEEVLFSISQNLKISASGKVSGQDINRKKRYINPNFVTVSTFDPNMQRFVLDFSGGINYINSKSMFFIKINYFEKEETFDVNPIIGANEILFQTRQNQEERKNNISKLGYLSLGGNYKLNNSNIFSLSLFHRKLSYDTPSEENYDDRDELLTMLHFRYTHIFSYLFKMNFNLEGSINHVVYLFSERSSNNNINRILRFSSEGIYSGKNVSSFNKAEVSANYTVYDFEDIIPNSKSFVYRQVLLRDSSSVYFSKLFGLRFLGYLKLAEQGQFKWQEFTEKPFQFRQEIYAEPLFLYKIWIVKIGAGLRLFTLNISNFENQNLKPLSEYFSIGPSFIANSDLTNNLRFILHGWYEFIKSNNNFNEQNLNFNLNLNWRI